MISDFLNSLEAERIKILFAPKNQKIRGLSSSFFDFKIALESTAGKQKVKAISVKPKSTTDKILVGLLWEAFFGKKFKVVHWFILFNVLIRTLKESKESEVLLGILTIMTANAATSHWRSNMKPLRTILYSRLDEEQADKLLNYLLDSIPVQLPKKRPKIENSLSVDLKGFIYQRAPKPKRYIAVGYKDKGSLGKARADLSDPSSEIQMEVDRTYEVLLRQVKSKYKNLIY